MTDKSDMNPRTDVSDTNPRADASSMANHRDAPVVLITGCSSGIGAITARLYARKGFRVYATVRRNADGEPLRTDAASAWHLRILEVDVDNDAQVSQAVATMLTETNGRIDIAVNNAGYYCFGPIEETRPEELRAQLETNVLGVLRVCRAVLPAMRARGGGAIINLSSVNGRTALPISGPYQISKFALEALTETLRYEVAPFGIRVVCIEPGPFDTDFHAKQRQTGESSRPDSPYASLIAVYQARLRSLTRSDPAEVARAIFDVSVAGSPPLRRPVGFLGWMGSVVRGVCPDRLFEWLVRIAFKIRAR